MQHNKRDGWTVFLIRCHNSNSDVCLDMECPFFIAGKLGNFF